MDDFKVNQAIGLLDPSTPLNRLQIVYQAKCGPFPCAEIPQGIQHRNPSDSCMSFELYWDWGESDNAAVDF